MTFLAPIWLLALLPWAGFAVWTWMGRRRRRWVPFLPLWDAPEELRRPKRGVEPPPLGLLLALLAMLMGIVAMARPIRRGQDRGGVTIIVDRGASMSAVVNGKARFVELAERAAPELLERLGPGSVELIDVVNGETIKTDRSDWPTRVAGWKRTAIDTSQAVAATVQKHLEQREAVIVLSDRDLAISNDQLVQFKPQSAVHNAGIIALAARPGQVMVTLRATDATTRTLSARSGSRGVEKRVDLKPGADQNVFLDLDAAEDVIEASIDGHDDFDGDDRAWLVRQRSWPIMQARTALPDELRRMIEVYEKHRPTDASSPRLAVGRLGEIKADEIGVELAPVETAESRRGPVGTAAHPVTNGVDWSALSRGAAVAARGPGEGWTKLAWLGDQTIVAVREGDVRQVWMGFDSREFARTPGFVVFWTNVFDWLGGNTAGGFGAAQIQGIKDARRIAPAKLSDDVEGAFWPGLFETAGGKVALNAGAVTFKSGGGTTGDLARLHLTSASPMPLERWLALVALLCLLGSAGVWEKRKRPNRALLDSVR